MGANAKRLSDHPAATEPGTARVLASFGTPAGEIGDLQAEIDARVKVARDVDPQNPAKKQLMRRMACAWLADKKVDLAALGLPLECDREARQEPAPRPTLNLVTTAGGSEANPAPHSLGVERGLLGTAAVHPEALAVALDSLNPEDLFDEFHRAFFLSLRDLRAAGKPTDEFHLNEELRRHKVFLASLAPNIKAVLASAVEPDKAPGMASLVRDKAKLRRLSEEFRGLEREAMHSAVSPEQLAEAARQRIDAIASAESPSGWEAPQLEMMLPAVPFPLSVLPKALAELCGTGAEVLFVPPEYVAVPILTIAGAAMGRSVGLQIQEGWVEYGSLYSAIVGTPGAAKTAALKLAARPALDVWKKNLFNHKLLLRRIESERLKREAKAKESKKLPRESEGEPPTLLRNVISDITCEAIGVVLSQNPRGCVMIHDELSGWINGMNQYKQGGGNDRQFFLRTWSFSSVQVDRKGQQDGMPLSIHEPFLGITGGIQPDLLNHFSHDGKEDGFVDRILCACPDEVPREFPKKAVADALVAPWHLAYGRLFDRELVAHGYDEGPHLVRFTPAGLARFEAWYNGICKEVEAPLFPRHLRGPWMKFLTYGSRLALIVEQLHAAFRPKWGRPSDVGSEAVEGMAALVEYFKTNYRRVYTIVHGVNTDNDLARGILAWAEKTGRERFTEREARDNFKHRLEDKPNDLPEALAWLVHRQAIRKAIAPPRTVGRMPSPSYEVNPFLLRKRPQNPQNSRTVGA